MVQTAWLRGGKVVTRGSKIALCGRCPCDDVVRIGRDVCNCPLPLGMTLPRTFYVYFSGFDGQDLHGGLCDLGTGRVQASLLYYDAGNIIGWWAGTGVTQYGIASVVVNIIDRNNEGEGCTVSVSVSVVHPDGTECGTSIPPCHLGFGAPSDACNYANPKVYFGYFVDPVFGGYLYATTSPSLLNPSDSSLAAGCTP